MSSIDWEPLPHAEALCLGAEWRDQGVRRLAWLAERSGVDTARLDLRAAGEVWRWYMKWHRKPSGADGAPIPVWWSDAPPADHWRSTDFDRAGAVGVDALTHVRAGVLMQHAPGLVLLQKKPPRRGVEAGQNEPSVGIEAGDTIWGWGAIVSTVAQCNGLHQTSWLKRRKLKQYPVEEWFTSALEYDMKNIAECFTAIGKDLHGNTDPSITPTFDVGPEPPYRLEHVYPDQGVWALGFSDAVVDEEGYEDKLDALAAWLDRQAGIASAWASDREAIAIEGYDGSADDLDALIRRGCRAAKISLRRR